MTDSNLYRSPFDNMFFVLLILNPLDVRTSASQWTGQLPTCSEMHISLIRRGTSASQWIWLVALYRKSFRTAFAEYLSCFSIRPLRRVIVELSQPVSQSTTSPLLDPQETTLFFIASNLFNDSIDDSLRFRSLGTKLVPTITKEISLRGVSRAKSCDARWRFRACSKLDRVLNALDGLTDPKRSTAPLKAEVGSSGCWWAGSERRAHRVEGDLEVDRYARRGGGWANEWRSGLGSSKVGGEGGGREEHRLEYVPLTVSLLSFTALERVSEASERHERTQSASCVKRGVGASGGVVSVGKRAEQRGGMQAACVNVEVQARWNGVKRVVRRGWRSSA
ncbi:hypothetical protein R3P38DRAFT_2764785 [Favolaschia claudopus]|uniref:Uncharacterized protein n=1 Tax=Favolaschia claudopus TaxID=2862362 RepID=A0AAW0DFA1_9AGAR